MKIGRVFLSGCAVYVLVTACSAMSSPGGESSSGGRSAGGNGHGGATGGFGGGSAGAGGRGGAGGFLDPVPPANADPTSGSRLKAKSWRGADGSVQYVAGVWWDSELEVDCTPARTSDGVMRCLPAPTNAAVSSGVYEDASCTTLLFYLQSPCDLGRLVMLYDHFEQCAWRYTVHEVGDRVTISTWYSLDAGGCTELPHDQALTFYRIGPELSPERFVEMTLRVEP